MKKIYLAVMLLGCGLAVMAQHDLFWTGGFDYGIPVNGYAQNRNVLRGTIPSRQCNFSTGLQYRIANRVGIDLGISQSIRTLRARDRQFASDAPMFKSIIKSKNHYLTLSGSLQYYVPIAEEDFFVVSGGYAWNFTGSKGLVATDTFYTGQQALAISQQYLGSNHAFLGEVGYQGTPAGRSTLYLGLKVNVGLTPFARGSYVRSGDANGAGAQEDVIQDKGSYIGLVVKYGLKVAHKEKVERQPKPAKVRKEKPAKVDSAPLEIKHILKDTMMVAGRAVAVGQSMIAKSADVTISIWDAEAIDGDSIALMLNGEYIIQNLSLTDEKIVLKAKLQPGKNYLVLYAHNQGKYPPNTAAIIVDDGIRKNQIALKSNLKTSGALEITLGQ